MVLLLSVIGFVTYDPASTNIVAQNASPAASEGVSARANPLDQLSSADIAVHVALLTDLDETVAVVNHADSVSAQLAVSPSGESVAAKPQIVSTDLKSKKDIIAYTVKAGDTLASVARSHGVTSDSIRWSNSLGGETLTAGQDLLIPPVNGIIYTVKAGDTVDGLVQRYSANRAQLIADNDAEVGGLKVGERILIRDGVRPAPTVSRYSYYGSYSFSAAYGGNGYDYGWCTWHVANRRIQAGRALPSNLGNAISWYYNAQRAGLSVGSSPRAGAVLWHANLGGLGHVGYVEKVNSNGSILVSDMNYPVWGGVTYRTIPPSEFGSYRFIY
jgi:surface antigen